jgi:hypothetical protein
MNRFSPTEAKLLIAGLANGLTYRQLADELGRSHGSVKSYIGRSLGARRITADDFARRCHEIIETQRGHAAHRSLDLLTNDVLRQLGFGRGVDIFEAAVQHWHEAEHPYPYSGPCPNCEPTARGASQIPTGGPNGRP